MAYYILNCTPEVLQTRAWPLAADEPHRDALAPGDRFLVYAGAPQRELLGHAELSSVDSDGLVLANVEPWQPPVPMRAVLSRLDASAKAKADFAVSVVRITDHEYETALAVAAERA